MTATTAAALIATCTQPWDLVVDLDPSPAVTAAANWLDRRVHTPPEGAAPDAPAMLVIARLPHDQAIDAHALAEWARARRSILSDGGHLIIAVDIGPPREADVGFTDRLTEFITAARATGLRYVQHLITVHATPETPSNGDNESLPARPSGGRHPRAHSDLLVFRAPTGLAGGRDE